MVGGITTGVGQTIVKVSIPRTYLTEIIFCASFQEAEHPQTKPFCDLWYESSSRMISIPFCSGAGSEAPSWMKATFFCVFL